MRQPRLEGQVLCYWKLARGLRMTRNAGLDDAMDVEELADLARFTENQRLRRACMSWLKCNVVDTAQDGGAA